MITGRQKRITAWVTWLAIATTPPWTPAVAASDDNERVEPFASQPQKVYEDMVLVPAPKPFLIDIFEGNKNGSTTDDEKPYNLQTVEAAAATCAQMGKRLPTQAEWLAAASALGKNRKYTLVGDKLTPPSRGEWAVNIKGPESYGTRDWPKLGIDAIGTVGMTGNRPEWVSDGPAPTQCGGGYEVSDPSDVELSRICSTRAEGRWRRRQLTGTVRCVVDYQPGDPVEVRYTSFVNGKLKDYVTQNTPAVVPAPEVLGPYDKIRTACEQAVANPNQVSWRGPLKDGFDGTQLYYALVEVVHASNPLGIRYFDCRYFGATGVRKLPRNHDPMAFMQVTLNAKTWDAWLQIPIFRDHSYGDWIDFEREILESLSWKGLQLPAEYREFQRLIDQDLVQEAIWELTDAGDTQISAKLRKALRRDLTSAKIASESNFTANGGVAIKSKLQLESGLAAIFKAQNAGYDHYPSEVAVSLIDEMLGMNFVPMAVIRQNSTGVEGSAAYFVKNGDTAGNTGRTTKISMLVVLDNLINNPDRHQGNYMWIDHIQKQIAIDHNRAFEVYREYSAYAYGTITSIPSRDLHQRLKDLTPEIIDSRFATLLPSAFRERFKANRTQVLATFDALVQRNGSRAYEK
ncbi:MAG: SUMF1/EgtB/PvdO family nonheme iron enzyme [Bacteriovoracia bacterium]